MERVRTLDHRVVDLRTAFHVVALDGEEFLQHECCAVRFERPHFHLTEALAAGAGLAAERLLGDEAVWTRRTSVNLVVDEVVELQDVHEANRGALMERLASATVVELDLAVRRHPCEEFARLARVLPTLLKVADALLDVLVRFVDRREDLVLVCTIEDRRGRLEAKHLRRPTKVDFENLTDVHAARHAERIEENVDRSAVFHERHVFLGNDTGDDTLVSVATCHLVADRERALRGEVDLHHFKHARSEFITALHVVELARLLSVGCLNARPELAVHNLRRIARFG